MIFLGYAFLSGKYTGDITPTCVSNIDRITLSNGIYDDLFVTKNISSPPIRQWDFDTILWAKFNGDFHAGNVSYTMSQISGVRIKRRKKGSYVWTILVDIPVRKVEDLEFERFDRYAQARTTYEYTLTPLLGSTEGNMNINSIESDFDGMFIMEAKQGFETDLEIRVETQRNHPSSVVNPLGGKYPFVIYNSEQNYDSGSATGLFALRNVENCDWDFDQSFIYRNQLNDFLANNRPKFLKLYDGRAWIVSVIDVITESESEHPDLILTTFQWVEVGKVDSSQDLYDNGLTDSNSENR